MLKYSYLPRLIINRPQTLQRGIGAVLHAALCVRKLLQLNLKLQKLLSLSGNSNQSCRDPAAVWLGEYYNLDDFSVIHLSSRIILTCCFILTVRWFDCPQVWF